MLIIDPHVHLRDFTQQDAETLEHGFRLAQVLGIAALLEMPNTMPPLMERTQITRRLQRADYALSQISPYQGVRPFHGLYAGVGADMDQVGAMVELQRELSHRVIGLKMYAGHSTGNLGVCAPADRQGVYRALAKADCRALVAVHCEREDLFHPELWQSSDAASHSRARPQESEVASIEEQLEFARQAGFRGQLHIAHISTADGVDLVEKARHNLPFRVSCGVCPQHLCLNTDSYARARQPLFLKVNPPLRSPSNQRRLWQAFLAGKIDWLESDHAPHTLQDKLEGFASGIPGLPFLRFFVDWLYRRLDASFVARVSAQNALECYRLPCLLEDELPAVDGRWRELLGHYPSDPYADLLSQAAIELDGALLSLT